MGSLPIQPPGPQPSPMGVPPPMYPAPGLMPYRQSVPSQLIGGLSDFMQSFVASRRATQQMAKDKFFEGLQMRTLGVPTYSDEQMAKFAKKAGFEYNFEPRSQEEEQQYLQQKSQQQINQANLQGVPLVPGQGMPGGGFAAPSPMSGMMGMPQQSQQVLPPQGAPPTGMPAPAPPPGFLGRIKNMLGLGQPSDQATAAMGTWLNRLGQASAAGGGYVGDVERQGELAALSHGFKKQFGFPLENMKAQDAMQALQVGNRAMQGDQDAMEQMARMSNGWQLPTDTFNRIVAAANPGMPLAEVRQKAANLFMYTNMGGKDYNMWLMNYAKDLAPNFNNNPFTAAQFLLHPADSPPPAMSTGDWQKFSEGLKPWIETYPTMTPSMANGLGMSYLSPNGEQNRQAIINQLSAKDSKNKPLFPTAESIRLSLQAGELGVNSMNAATRLSEVNDLIGYHKGLNDIAKMNAARESLTSQDKLLWDMVMSGKGTYAQEQAFTDMIARNQNNLASLPIKLSDGTITHMANPVDVIGGFRMGGISSALFGTGPVIMPRGGMGMPMGMGGQPDRVTEAFTNILRQFARMPSEERPMMLDKAKSMMDPQMYKLLVDRVSSLPTMESRLGGTTPDIQIPGAPQQ